MNMQLWRPTRVHSRSWKVASSFPVVSFIPRKPFSQLAYFPVLFPFCGNSPFDWRLNKSDDPFLAWLGPVLCLRPSVRPSVRDQVMILRWNVYDYYSLHFIPFPLCLTLNAKYWFVVWNWTLRFAADWCCYVMALSMTSARCNSLGARPPHSPLLCHNLTHQRKKSTREFRVFLSWKHMSRQKGFSSANDAR